MKIKKENKKVLKIRARKLKDGSVGKKTGAKTATLAIIALAIPVMLLGMSFAATGAADINPVIDESGSCFHDGYTPHDVDDINDYSLPAKLQTSEPEPASGYNSGIFHV